MVKVVSADDIEFKKVDWGRTKELVAPQNLGSEKLKVKITEYLPGYVHKLHVHPEQEEVIYVLSGKGITQTQEGEIKVGPGSVIYVPAGEPHKTWNPSKTEPLRVIVAKSPPDDTEMRID
jgi:mannose-6-phosphate isomerase-like protein (cupin superfamily)